MLQSINRVLEKWMPLVTPTSVAIGLMLSVWLSPFTAAVPWIFAFMTFSGSLGMNFRDLQRVMTHPLPILLFLVVVHAVMPLLAWSMGHLAFPDDPLTITGLILLLAIPTGIVSFMWVTIYKGHTALTLSIILIDTFLSPFLVPYTLSLLIGAKVEMDTWGMLQGLVWMVVVPSLLGMAINQWTKGRAKTEWGPKLAPFSKIGLALVVMINSSVIAPYFKQWDSGILFLGVVCVFVVALGYVIGWGSARLFRMDRGTAVSLMFNCGMRNISAGAVLATSFFPPAVAVPTIIGMLFQQMMASLFGYVFFSGKMLKAAGGSVPQSKSA